MDLSSFVKKIKYIALIEHYPFDGTLNGYWILSVGYWLFLNFF